MLHQQLLEKERSSHQVLSAMDTRESLGGCTAKEPQFSQPIPEVDDSSQNLRKTGSSVNSEELSSARLLGRKDSLQSPKQKRVKKGSSGRFSLKIRQVESIR
jgi:hypothetical protein